MRQPWRLPVDGISVIAVGGNAILRPGESGSVEEMRRNIARFAVELAKLIGNACPLVLTHGNGPQVGNILLRSDEAKDKVPPLPLDVAVAHSQGELGYLLQEALAAELPVHSIHRDAVTLITRSVVDPRDPALYRPTKPVGPFYSKSAAQELARKAGWTMAEDAGRGYRRIVPSPLPVRIVESRIIRTLALRGTIVVCAGGGGIPVMEHRTGYHGVEAVVDKDLASAVLAREIGAKRFIVLTEVERVAVNYNRPGQRWLDKLSTTMARRYRAEGHFPPGSMGPKIEAALLFLHGRREAEVLITSPYRLGAALAGKTGTRIVSG